MMKDRQWIMILFHFKTDKREAAKDDYRILGKSIATAHDGLHVINIPKHITNWVVIAEVRVTHAVYL
jgi:hypothetical protein